MNEKSVSSRCRLWTGCSPQPVAELLDRLLAGDLPVLVWREPVNARAPIPGFAGLFTPAAWPSQPRCVLNEARLFFAAGMLHLLAGPQATRWAAWHDDGDAGTDGPAPAWLPSQVEPAPPMRLLRKSRPMLLDNGRDTRGLSRASFKDEAVTAVEYYDRGILRWWRLKSNGTS